MDRLMSYTIIGLAGLVAAVVLLVVIASGAIVVMNIQDSIETEVSNQIEAWEVR